MYWLLIGAAACALVAFSWAHPVLLVVGLGMVWLLRG
jgi:hypothetical protein